MTHPSILRSEPGWDGRFTLAGQPALFHSHHYSLQHDQAIDDILGEQRGARLRMEAAREAFTALLEAASPTLDGSGMAKGAFAEQLFGWMGQGYLSLPPGGLPKRANGVGLTQGLRWREKFGQRLSRTHPADALAAGFAAAAVAFSEGLDASSVEAQEGECVAMRSPSCTFHLRSSSAAPLLPPAGSAKGQAVLVEALPKGGLEDHIAPMTQIIQARLGGNEMDLGLCGSSLALHLAGYQARGSQGALALVRRESASHVSVAEELLREAARLGTFHAFAGLLTSTEWPDLLAPVGGEEVEVLACCCAIARALGWGCWVIQGHAPGKGLQLRALSDPESPFQAVNGSEQSGAFLLQGAAQAMMTLAVDYPWDRRPDPSDFYLQLSRKGGSLWRVEQTQFPGRGDAYAEVVVQRG